MSDFEIVFLCLVTPVLYALIYTAGQCDFIKVVPLMMREWAKKTEEALKDGEDT